MPVCPSSDVALEGDQLRVYALVGRRLLLVTGKPDTGTPAALRAIADAVEAALGGAAPEDRQRQLL